MQVLKNTIQPMMNTIQLFHTNFSKMQFGISRKIAHTKCASFSLFSLSLTTERERERKKGKLCKIIFWCHSAIETRSEESCSGSTIPWVPPRSTPCWTGPTSTRTGSRNRRIWNRRRPKQRRVVCYQIAPLHRISLWLAIANYETVTEDDALIGHVWLLSRGKQSERGWPIKAIVRNSVNPRSDWPQNSFEGLKVSFFFSAVNIKFQT